MKALKINMNKILNNTLVGDHKAEGRRLVGDGGRIFLEERLVLIRVCMVLVHDGEGRDGRENVEVIQAHEPQRRRKVSLGKFGDIGDRDRVDEDMVKIRHGRVLLHDKSRRRS